MSQPVRVAPSAGVDIRRGDEDERVGAGGQGGPGAAQGVIMIGGRGGARAASNNSSEER